MSFFKKIIFIVVAGLLTPITLLAQIPRPVDAPQTPHAINDIFSGFAMGNLIGYIPTLILIAFVTFFAGILKYLAAGDNEEGQEKGRQVMVWGIIVLFVMISTWGFVRIIYGSFFEGDIQTPNYLPELL